MDTYKIIKKGVFERDSTFEERINTMARDGWCALNIAVHGGSLVVLMQKKR